MNKNIVSRFFSRAKRAWAREVGASRRGRQFFRFDVFHLLEGRQLLSGMVTETVTYTATVPAQTTDYTVPLTLPKFSPSLGTLKAVDLKVIASGNVSGAVVNNGTDPETLSAAEAINVALLDGSTPLLAPVLNVSQTFTDLAGGGSGQFGPFAPTQTATTTYTSGAAFNDFAGGPGNLGLTVQTNTEQTTTGGGGNIAANLVTTAGATATVTYTYTVATVSLSGNVYDDLKGTGALAVGDPPIPGTLLTLVNSAGATVATTSTAADGTYSFATTASGGPLLAGTYSIVESQPFGYLQGTNTVGTVNGVTTGTLPATDVIGSIALAPGQDSIGNNFGEVLPVTLSGTVYVDVNQSGRFVAGDPPIPGTVLELFNSAGTDIALTQTNALGGYSFTTGLHGVPLAPGTYSIVEAQPFGYLQGTNTVGTVNGVTTGTLPATDVIGSIALTSGQASINNNFGEVLPVTLSGTVYVDANHTGSLAAGDPPIPGVELELFGPTGLEQTTLTDSMGNYAFTFTNRGLPLVPGTYAIRELQPAGYLQGTNTVGTVNGVTTGALTDVDLIGSIALASGRNSIHNNFGEILPTTIVPVNLTNVQRFGVHLQPTLIVLTFDQPLDPATAQNVANYQIFGPTDSAHPALIPVESAVYNPATNMVTLHPGERLDVHHPYRLIVSGVRSSTGGALIGSDGVAGDPYVTTLNRTTLSGFTDIYGNFIPINHGKLYPAAVASGYQLKRFAAPANLGSFAAVNKATFLVATAGAPETPPIAHHHAKKLSTPARHRR